MELDHLFICTAIDAPAAKTLREFGLVEGTPNTHLGQGSANRRFFFRNFMLELLWVHDVEEARTQPIHLADRWLQRHTHCPFGLCLRPSASRQTPAFPTWDYHPPYLPSHLSIQVGDNIANLAEPMLFFLAFGHRPDRNLPEKQQPLDHHHRPSLQEVTRIAFTSPSFNAPSAALQALIATQLITVEPGDRHEVTLGFDHETQGQQTHFFPHLPLRFSW
ncbi:MAG: hypothetical protein AAFQ61_08225 [Cyanobacteria bacterium J06626_23]